MLQRVAVLLVCRACFCSGVGSSLLPPRALADCASVLQCVAVCCCRELHCVAVSALHCVAVSSCQCVVVCCSALQCVAVCCSVLQCAAVCCSVLRCVAVLSRMILQGGIDK